MIFSTIRILDDFSGVMVTLFICWITLKHLNGKTKNIDCRRDVTWHSIVLKFRSYYIASSSNIPSYRKLLQEWGQDLINWFIIVTGDMLWYFSDHHKSICKGAYLIFDVVTTYLLHNNDELAEKFTIYSYDFYLKLIGLNSI